MRRIGVLVIRAENDPEVQASLAGFRQGLEQFGWSEGRNVRFDIRFARSNRERIQALAKEIVALQPDVTP
jgi:putative ABC transport system substrate-binding protein